MTTSLQCCCWLGSCSVEFDTIQRVHELSRFTLLSQSLSALLLPLLLHHSSSHRNS